MKLRQFRLTVEIQDEGLYDLEDKYGDRADDGGEIAVRRIVKRVAKSLGGKVKPLSSGGRLGVEEHTFLVTVPSKVRARSLECAVEKFNEYLMVSASTNLTSAEEY